MIIKRVQNPEGGPPTYVTIEGPPSYYEFARTVKEKSRFILETRPSQFLATVREQCRDRMRKIKKDQLFWRARADYRMREIPISDDDFTAEPAPLPPEQMIPKAEHTRNGGRANPPGIAYLYICTKPETALAECRPWLNEIITVGLFKAERDLQVVLCDQRPNDEDIFLELEGKLTDEPRNNRLWADIGSAFSVPVSQNDAAISYVPTQILAEAFKAEGADGVAYRSRLSPGTNIVLFDLNSMAPVRQYLYSTSKIFYEFEAEPNYEIWMKDEKVSRVVSRLESASANGVRTTSA